MKYNLNFFVRDSAADRSHVNIHRVAECKSDHIPLKGDLIYLGSDIFDDHDGVSPIFRVLYSVKVFDITGFSNIEVLLKETKL